MFPVHGISTQYLYSGCDVNLLAKVGEKTTGMTQINKTSPNLI